jgi:hypothetical protein
MWLLSLVPRDQNGSKKLDRFLNILKVVFTLLALHRTEGGKKVDEAMTLTTELRYIL